MSASADTLAHRLTHRDLEHTPEDGNLYEIIDGELHVTPAPTFAHQLVISHLMRIIAPFVHAHRLGAIFTSGLKVVLGEPTGVEPDLVFVSTKRMELMRADGYHGAPDLLIEVVSSRPQLDRYVKFRKYASAGVPHYWIADPSTRTLEIYRLDGATYRLAHELEGKGGLETELFPGLTIEIAELWH